MNSTCAPLIAHINRLEGQLRTLKNNIEANAECSTIVQLALSASKSFDSLRAKLVEEYVKEHFIKNVTLSKSDWDDFSTMLKLIKV